MVLDDATPKFAYWGVHGYGTDLVYEKQKFVSLFEPTVLREKATFTDSWDFMEFLITSPEPPVIGMRNGSPVF